MTRTLNLTSIAVATSSSTKIINGIPQSADKAIDGFIDVTNFAETKQEERNWIRIDLGNVFKISSIYIFLFGLENGKTVRLGDCSCLCPAYW